MKPYRNRLALYGIAVLLLNLSAFHATAKETWFITSLNWQPYSGSEMINEGNAIQRLKSLLAESDIQLLVEFYPWSRAQRQAKEKGYVGYFPAWPEEVQTGFIASSPIAWSDVAVLKMKNTTTRFIDIDQLFRDHSVGLVRTYNYPASIMDAAQKYPDNVLYADNELLLAKKLHAGRHTFAITDPLVMSYIAEKHSLEGIEMASLLYKKPLVIAMTNSAENQRRIRLIKQIIEEKGTPGEPSSIN